MLSLLNGENVKMFKYLFRQADLHSTACQLWSETKDGG